MFFKIPIWSPRTQTVAKEYRGMKEPGYIRPLFYVAGLYDGLLGLLFILVPLQIYTIFGVTPPNHLAYVQFPAALLIIFAIMFFVIARNPLQQRDLIPYGILLKVAFCGIAFSYWTLQGIPDMWKPFAIADFAFLILFLLAYRNLCGIARETY